MAKSDARFEYRANLQRQDHDLSQKLGFTSASGMLLPIWFDLATPGDSYYMRHKLPLLRSSQLAAPAMVDVKVHFETFFVPMQMIYEPFENSVYSLNHFRSSFYNVHSEDIMKDKFPLFDYGTFVGSTILTDNPDNDFHADAFRLADLFGLYPRNFTGVESAEKTNFASFFPYQLLAYHTIFEYYYRLDDKSQFDNILCNFDKYYDNSAQVQMPAEFMSIHQRPWAFDYYTSIYRSPIVSDANTTLLGKDNLVEEGIFTMPNSKYMRINSAGTEANHNGAIVGFSGAFDWFSNYSSTSQAVLNSTYMIRQMFANEKLAMITGRAKKTYDAQVLAHLGVNVPHDVKHDITMIHHDEYDLNVQEVTSLASTSDAPLGELAGKSYASGNGESFKFTAPCHGVMMTIFSVEPKKKYNNTFDRINMIHNVFDIPTPEFDRLGNQPMFRSEVGIAGTLDANDVIGWKERYYGFKRKADKTTLAFTQDTGTDALNNYSAYMLSSRPFSVNREDNIDSVRPDLESRFYIERNAVDPLCMVNFSYGWKIEQGGENWNLTPWLAYARDPFIIDSDIQCKKVSWMSKDGEPIYL